MTVDLSWSWQQLVHSKRGKILYTWLNHVMSRTMFLFCLTIFGLTRNETACKSVCVKVTRYTDTLKKLQKSKALFQYPHASETLWEFVMCQKWRSVGSMNQRTCECWFRSFVSAYGLRCLLVLTMVWYTSVPLWWRQQVASKPVYPSTKLHNLTFQKTLIFLDLHFPSTILSIFPFFIYDSFVLSFKLHASLSPLLILSLSLPILNAFAKQSRKATGLFFVAACTSPWITATAAAGFSWNLIVDTSVKIFDTFLLSPRLVFMIETDCVLCEVRSEVKKALRTENPIRSIIIVEYWRSRDISCKSPLLRYIDEIDCISVVMTQRNLTVYVEIFSVFLPVCKVWGQKPVRRTRKISVTSRNRTLTLR